MLPVIAIVGRPNVGKSTLFNVLTGTRDALVYDMPGVTRDRQYGKGKVGDKPYMIVDTGGLAEPDDPDMTVLTDSQVWQAINEADKIIFLVDYKSGITALDEKIAKELRPYLNKVTLVVNKADREEAELAASEFYSLGVGEPHVIAAAQKRGVAVLMSDLLADLPEMAVLEEGDDSIPVAIVGRPNVGKSTLINRIMGEERVVVMDRPGTTRDSVFVPFERFGQQYTLIDTAGVRRRTKIKETVEKFSVIKTWQAIEAARVVVVVLDATQTISDQDLRLIRTAVEKGRALVLAFNKWDALNQEQRKAFLYQVDLDLEFADFARRYHISALHGSGVGDLFRAINECFRRALIKPSTSELTNMLAAAIAQHQPPLSKGRRIKPRYMHIGGYFPLRFVIHGRQVKSLPKDYQRFLINYFRKHYKLTGVPIELKFIEGDNPFDQKA